MTDRSSSGQSVSAGDEESGRGADDGEGGGERKEAQPFIFTAQCTGILVFVEQITII